MLRELLYPLGLLASLCFGARFLIQWYLSEKKQQSLTPKIFWRLSLLGNAIMVLHSLIQVQLPVALIQALNGAISWRNLNLQKKSPLSTKKFLVLIPCLLLPLLGLFFVMSHGETTWMRVPTLPWQSHTSLSIAPLWHALGTFGLLLFASRFWVQWWYAEKAKKGLLNPAFWWISLSGGALCLIYFLRLKDPVNILGYGLGLIPYARNLLLLAKTQQKKRPFAPALFLFAGEKSADVLGAELIKALKNETPTLRFYGVGGEHLQKNGLEVIAPTSAFNVMGFSAVIKKLPSLLKHLKTLSKRILNDNPQAVILIDYPDFNMRLAKKLRKKGYSGKIIQYVSPTVWAWRKGRIKELQKRLDHLLSILPFEEEVYAKSSLPVTFVGHPLVSTLIQAPRTPSWKKACGLPPNKPLISLFPGSRLHEIEHNLKQELLALAPFVQTHALALSLADEKLRPTIEKIVQDTPLTLNKDLFLIPHKYRYEHMEASIAALATSGTVTLELALYEVPTVVCYTLSRLNYLLARYLFRIKVPFISLINLICEKEVFPEFIALRLNAKELNKKLNEMMTDKRAETLKGCALMKNRLTAQDASQKAAQTIARQLQS